MKSQERLEDLATEGFSMRRVCVACAGHTRDVEYRACALTNFFFHGLSILLSVATKRVSIYHSQFCRRRAIFVGKDALTIKCTLGSGCKRERAIRGAASPGPFFPLRGGPRF
jgi:hypothetical protein